MVFEKRIRGVTVTYRYALGLEDRNGVVEDILATAHDGDGSSMFAELGGNLEADTRPASGEESYFAFEYISLERRLHFYL